MKTIPIISSLLRSGELMKMSNHLLTNYSAILLKNLGEYIVEFMQ